MTISNITINGHTYTDADWRANFDGTLSAVANDIASMIAALSLVGTLSKALADTNTTLTSDEGANLTFIFTGTLTAARTITFPAGFSKSARIVNNTTGGFALTIGYAAGTTVSIPASGSADVYGDGTNFNLSNGIARTSGGASVVGTLTASGVLSAAAGANLGATGISGNAAVTGVLTVSDAATITGLLSAAAGANFGPTGISGALAATGAVTFSSTMTLSGAATFSSTMTVSGAATFAGSVTWGNDPNCYLTKSGSNVIINADTNTYIEFQASTRKWRFVIDGVLGGEFP